MRLPGNESQVRTGWLIAQESHLSEALDRGVYAGGSSGLSASRIGKGLGSYSLRSERCGIKRCLI
jgi:hypothetical protein